MDAMECLMLELPSIMLLTERLSLASSQEEIDEINEEISDVEMKLVKCFSLEHFWKAKKFYEDRIAKGKTIDLFGVKTKDLLVYIEKIINMKKERGM